MRRTHLVVSYSIEGEPPVQALACNSNRNNIDSDGDGWLGDTAVLPVVTSNAGVVDCWNCLVAMKSQPNAAERAYKREVSDLIAHIGFEVLNAELSSP